MTSTVGRDANTPAAECADRATIAACQGRRLKELLAAIQGRNAFYTRKFSDVGITSDALSFPEDLPNLPLTTKAELIADQDASPPWGTILTEPLERYTRYNQTSSTTGRPLRWPDTPETWQWMLDCWRAVYRGARVGSADRILFAFSFGPFLGFWTAFDAACQLGAHAVPTGGMSSQQRLALIEAIRPTVLVCTPTYALRLAEVAREQPRGALLAESSIHTIIVAGEPGGNIPATRHRIEQSWGARVINHHGLTEVGPVSFECWEAPGFLHLNEHEFVCEVLDPSTLSPVADRQRGELIVTNLGRSASPVIRYRTGDLVIRCSEPCVCGRTLARVEGGIIGRTDDMVTIRGVNVYPTAIEAVVRGVEDVAEFRSTVSRSGAMLTLSLDVELVSTAADATSVVARITRDLREALGLAVPVHVVTPGTLPRFEMKARRFVVQP